MKTALLFANGFVLFNTVMSLVSIAACPTWRPVINLVSLALIKSHKKKADNERLYQKALARARGSGLHMHIWPPNAAR